jgi:PAS domain S-box-containing protein
MPRIKILLVEDDSLVAKDIMQILESYNYEVYCIESADNDVAKALKNNPDLVLIDLKGNAANLNKFLSAVKDLGVPSVILTDEEQPTGFKQKYGFLKKPYDPVDLRNIIEVTLYAHEMDLKLKRSENRYKNILKNIQDAYIRTDNEGNIVMASPSAFAIESIEMERERQIFADALTESETNYRELVDNSIIAIYKTDLEGNIIFANNAMVDLFKFGNQKNIMEINASQLYKNSLDRKNLIKIIKEKGKVKQYEVEMVANTGEVMYIHLSAKLSGNIISGMLVNYTELKKVERELILSQEEWENTFNAVPDLISILDTGHTILNCNKSMASRLGLKPEECIGLKCYEMVHGLDAPPFFCPQTKLANDSNEHTIEMQEDILNGNFNVSVTPLKDSNGKLIGSVHIARDITSRKLAEERLKESENRYRKVGELISDFAYSCVHNESGDYEVDWITNSFFNITGYTRKELELHKCWLFTVHPEDEEISVRQLKSIKPGEISVEDFRVINSQGEVRWLKNHVECVEDIIPGKLRIYGAAQDTTEINQALTELQKSEEKFKAIINNSSDIIRILDKNGKVVFDSPASERILGYPLGSLNGTDPIEFIHPDDVEVVKNNLKKVYKNPEHRTPIEFRIKKADDTYLPVESIAQNMFDVPSVGGIVVNTHPIKARKEMENEIKSSLREKEILLKEIHHRVKNNMQIISSLLNLQKEYVEEEEAVNVLQESQNRVKTMSLIHEKLYQSNDIAHINIAEYIENLVNDLFYSYAIKRENIKSVLDINEIKLNIETALPCGLIISELVSNTLKYAFPNDKKGELKVSLVRKGEGFLLIIEDNGVGLPEDIDFKNTDSLGMQLVINLVEQLEGEITLDNSNGSKFLITFKELQYKERV